MGIVDQSDRVAIEQVIHRYFRLVDAGRAAEVISLFAPDGRVTFGPGSPKPGTIESDAIPAAMAARQAQTGVVTRHVLTNIALAPRADGTIAAYSLMTLYRREAEGEPVVVTVADLEDVYARHDGEWRIADRMISPAFSGL